VTHVRSASAAPVLVVPELKVDVIGKLERWNIVLFLSLGGSNDIV